MRNYLKKNRGKAELEALAEEVIFSEESKKNSSKKPLLVILLLFIAGFSVAVCGFKKDVDYLAVEDIENIQLASTPMAAAGTKRGTITIPVGVVKANPFLPYRDISGTKGLDVPSASLIEPLESLQADSEAARVMDTIVSGILYDKYSPSAILNIEGNDYLVKKGDVVNNYKVLDIVQESVTVKLGNNVYKAGIGEILTEGTLNHNDVSNLSNKFGGER